MMSLPMLSRATGWSLDGLRSFVRARPELRALGTNIGPCRVYSAEEVQKIREAWEERRAAKAKT
jgi:hypothetical protein